MKKFLVGIVMMFVFAVGIPLTIEAHASCPRHRSARKSSNSRNYARTNRSYRTNRNYRTTSANQYYATGGDVYRRPSFYRRHRNLINVGVGAGGGALIGGLVGGKRGALIGTGVGAGSSALYTYVLNPKKRRYVRR